MTFTRPGQMLSKMITLAVTSHEGQYDKGGLPYILHPLTVMHKLHTTDEELQCIAIGHDLIEDTGVTYLLLRQMGFPERVIEGIDALTKRRGETYDEYIDRVKLNRDAVLVKMADLRHNSDIKRLKGVTDKDVTRMVKYHNTWVELSAVVE